LIRSLIAGSSVVAGWPAGKVGGRALNGDESWSKGRSGLNGLCGVAGWLGWGLNGGSRFWLVGLVRIGGGGKVLLIGAGMLFVGVGLVGCVGFAGVESGGNRGSGGSSAAGCLGNSRGIGLLFIGVVGWF